ncbi:MAG: hypothetical protein KDD25_05045, partial [Bdellovibrionales bacterium]|nr:hypothetical protein [Bdellovibrionales bacterium]
MANRSLLSLARIILMVSLPSFAYSAAVDCEDIVVKGQIAETLEAWDHQSSQIRDLLSGKLVKESLNSVFSIDLSDGERVAQRKVELKKKLETQLDEEMRQLPFSECIIGKKADENNVEEIRRKFKELVELKLKFLDLPSEKRLSILGFQSEQLKNRKEIEEIQKVQGEVEENANQISKLLNEVEKSSQRKNLDDDSAESLLLVRKVRKEIVDLKLKITEKAQQRLSRISNARDTLNQFATLVNRNDSKVSRKDLLQGYRSVTTEWRILLDDLFKSDNESDAPPKIPTFDESTLSEETQREIQEAKEERARYLELRKNLESEGNNRKYGLILTAGRLRAQFLEKLKKNSRNEVFELNNENVEDLVREIRLIPYRPV